MSSHSRVSTLQFCLSLALLSTATTSFAKDDARPPNIVLLLVDDLGWADVGCNGSTFYATPSIDSLASAGMRFTDAYAACPVCSPTRASIQTGKYPARLQLTDFLVGRRQPNSPILTAEFRHYLPLEEVTLAEALRPAGYKSAHMGKWHLGTEQYFPERQGYDVNVGGTRAGAPASYFYPAWKKNVPLEGSDGQYLTDRLTDEAVKFIAQNKDRPFFLNLCYYNVHIPIQARKDLLARYQERARGLKPDAPQRNAHYGAMVAAVDESVGRILKTLDEQHLVDNTVVIFTSDNGGLSVPEGPHTPATSNAPLRAGKGYLYEGGIREPLLVRWPGRVKAGSVCREPVCSIDLYPTILAIAGVRPAEKQIVDGVSLLPLLQGQVESLNRDALYWHYPHFSNQGGRPGAAIRAGRYKLIERYEDGSLELYDLQEDLGEQSNLAEKQPDKTRQLQEKLARWRDQVQANMPQRNPNYKP